MQSVLVSDVVSAVITELSQVPGIAVQQYSSERIRQHVESAVLMELPEAWWIGYMWEQTITLSGVNGLPNEALLGPISGIDNYEDIQAVWPEGVKKQLPAKPPYANASAYATGGGKARWIAPNFAGDTNKPFKVLPYDATGSLYVRARQRPVTPLSLTDRVYIDRQLLIWGASWLYCCSDGTNPTEVAKYEMLAVKRRKQCINMMNNQPIPLDPNESDLDDMLTDVDMSVFTLDEHPLG